MPGVPIAHLYYNTRLILFLTFRANTETVDSEIFSSYAI